MGGLEGVLARGRIGRRGERGDGVSNIQEKMKVCGIVTALSALH